MRHFKLVIVGILLLLAGCKTATTTDTVKTTPVLVNNAADDVARADDKLAKAQPMLPTTAPARVLVDGARGDLDQAKGELGNAGKQAQADAAHNAANDAKIAKLEANDPFRTWLIWVGGGIVLLGVVAGGLALWLKSKDFGMLAGYLAGCGIAMGLIGDLLPTVEAIFKWLLVGGTVAAVVLVAYLVRKWYQKHQEALANLTVAKTIVTSIETAKAAGALVMTDATKAVLDVVQTPAAKALVSNIQGK